MRSYHKEVSLLTYPLETTRLIIRRFEPQDWLVVQTYATDPTVMRYMGEGPQTPTQVQTWVNGNLGDSA